MVVLLLGLLAGLLLVHHGCTTGGVLGGFTVGTPWFHYCWGCWWVADGILAASVGVAGGVAFVSCLLVSGCCWWLGVGVLSVTVGVVGGVCCWCLISYRSAIVSSPFYRCQDSPRIYLAFLILLAPDSICNKRMSQSHLINDKEFSPCQRALANSFESICYK
mmetsp:Transcript_42349/g.67904  ORF Transcript_42349/g.67904 Transcript_42349/m.67904 type:complete len:162 (-) Transcript_42349:10-495(-)